MKPLNRKAYGSIGHLPNSRMGPGDHSVPEGQSLICTTKARDKHDRIIVQEKLDGSCVAAARVGDQILALGRAGHLAQSSPYIQHQWFAAWVRHNEYRFLSILEDGERLVGEWLAQAHGTRYQLNHEPFVAFDIMREADRVPFDEFRLRAGGFVQPHLVHEGSPLTTESAMAQLGQYGRHWAVDPVEGVVYRVERCGKVDFLAKYVRPDKVDGRFLPEVSGADPVWNWAPQGLKRSSESL